jgi:hypothetical protein
MRAPTGSSRAPAYVAVAHRGADVNANAPNRQKLVSRLDAMPRQSRVPERAMDPPKPTPPDDDGLEFELTDLEDARRVLDEESISQFDVAGAASPAQWKRLRRSSLPTDRALSGSAIDWLIALPPTLRPEHLPRRFPRIVNALAVVWHDADACHVAMAKLLDDTRKGRQGFPPEVRAELVALRDWIQVF